MEREGDDSRLVIFVRGEIDLLTCVSLGAELCGATKQASEVVVDLAGVGFLDSSGIRVLVDARRGAVGLGHVLYVENAHGWVQRVLEITGVLQLLAKP